MKMGTRAGLALLATVWMASSAMAQNIEGTWQGRIGDDGDRSQIQMRVDSRGGYNSMSLSSSIVALLLDNFDRDGELAYRLERDAGSIQFVGSMRQDRVLGGFTFTANPEFARRMADFGFRGLSEQDQFAATVHDIGPERVRELQSLGFRGIGIGISTALSGGEAR